MIKKFFITGLLLIVMLTGIMPAIGQEQDHPLLQMLNMVPADYAGSPIAYLDFRAVEDARDYLEKPESYAALMASDVNLDFTWRWQSAPESVGRNFARLEEMPVVMGFDFFDINRTLQFGMPPAMGIIWQGNFDMEQVAEAHTARDYIETEINGITAWCPAAGCDQGMQTDVRNAQPANIFDNGIGRKVPFLVQPGYLLSSPDLGTLEASVGAINGKSLADDPAYRALAEAFTMPEGLLIGVQFLDSTVQVSSDLDAALPAEIAAYGSLPPYLAVAIADRQEGDQQVALIALAYANVEEAEAAAPELANRISTFSDVITRGEGQSPLMEDVRGAEVSSRVYSTDEISVAVVEIRYDTPTQEEENATPSLENNPVRPALVYWYLTRAYRQRSLYPLWVMPE